MTLNHIFRFGGERNLKVLGTENIFLKLSFLREMEQDNDENICFALAFMIKKS